MFNQLMRLMRRFRRGLTQVWDNLIDWVNPPQPPRSNSPRLPDSEYEWLFRQLLTQVGQGWNRDQVRRWLRRNEYRVTESRWKEWSPRFHNSAKDAEISRQLLLLAQLDCEYISQIAANLLGETPPKPPPRETNTPPPNNPPTSTDSLPTDAERWFDDGLQRYDNGDFRGAISSYDQALKFKPDDLLAWGNRGNALYNLGKYEEALSSYDQAIKIKPDFHLAWNNRGLALGNLGEYEQALSSIDQAIKIKPDYPEAWNNRGLALGNLGEYEQALSSIDQAIKIKPDFHLAWNNRGLALGNLGEYEQALSSYDQAIKIKPDDHLAWFNRGLVLSDLGEYEQALSSFDQALKFKPDFHEAWNDRGLALYNLGEYEQAISSYDQAIKIKPDDHLAWFNRGIAARQSRCTTPFIVPDINSPRLSEILQNPSLDLRDYPGEIASYQEGLKHCPKSTHPTAWGFLHHVIGKARYLRGQFATASHRITDEFGQPQTARYYYQQAVESYQEALTVITPDADRELYLTIVIDLISALCKLGENQSARQWHHQGFATLQTWINQIYHQRYSQPEKVSLSPPVNPEDETPQLVPGNFRESQSIPAVKRLMAKFTLFYRFAFDFASQDHNWHQALETAELEKNIHLTWLLSTASQPADISPTVAQIQTLVKAETAIIYWYYSSHSLTTFILTRDDLTAIPFSASAQEKLETLITHWNRDYQNYSLKKTSDSQSWQQRLKTHIDSMHTLLNIPEITAKLPPEISNLILIPHRDLHRFPLEALFPHDFIITRLPSAAFGYGHSSSPLINPNSGVSVLTVAYPDSIGAKNLPFTQTEVTAIGQIFTGYNTRYQTITDQQATEETVISALTENHQIFHFSGHGDYNHEKPNLSSLLLSGSEHLRGEKIASLSLTSYGLVYLNACETGLTNMETIEKEYVGLASAFLRGGVSQVVSSLWLVNDESGAVLAIKFYQEYLGGETAAVALHQAKNWLRFEATWAEIAKVYEYCLSHPSVADDNRGILLKALGRIQRQEDPEVKPFSDVYYWSSLVISGY
jgi:tetratricopeptide (TPR) repeat protein